MAWVDNDVAGKLALITGASGGIGSACAKALWLQKASLALTYMSGEARIVKLVDELCSLRYPGSSVGRLITTHKIDMASPVQMEDLFAEIVKRHGQAAPDILISNAGYGRRITDILQISTAEWDYTMNINLKASFLLCKLSIQYMQSRRWGRIVFVSSIAAQGGGINGCHYAASKAGLEGLMKNLAAQYAKDGITVNDVAPAMIGGTCMIPSPRTVEGTAGDIKNIPVGRLGLPVEVANVVLMFCQTGYMTGQSVLLSGGLK